MIQYITSVFAIVETFFVSGEKNNLLIYLEVEVLVNWPLSSVAITSVIFFVSSLGFVRYHYHTIFLLLHCGHQWRILPLLFFSPSCILLLARGFGRKTLWFQDQFCINDRRREKSKEPPGADTMWRRMSMHHMSSTQIRSATTTTLSETLHANEHRQDYTRRAKGRKRDWNKLDDSRQQRKWTTTGVQSKKIISQLSVQLHATHMAAKQIPQRWNKDETIQ